MSLDPVFAPLRQIPRPDFGDIPAARARAASMQALLPRRQSAAVAFDDREIDGPGGKIRIRVYDPKERGRTGALVYFHGGGFMVGDLDTEHSQCLDHAEDAGCVVVSVAYRLAPEFPFPAAHDDAWAALRWVVVNADALRVDANRLAVGGGSAGATLAAGVALRARDEGSPSIRLALLVQPAFDHLQTQPSARSAAATPFMTSADLPSIWRTYLGAALPTGKALSYAAPAAAEHLRGFSPVFLIVGDVDPEDVPGLEAKSGQPLPLSPRFSTALTTAYDRPLWDCCSAGAGLSFRFVGRRPSGFDGSTVHPQYWLDGYGMLDLRAGFQWKAVDLSLSLKNVFNTLGGISADASALQYDADAPVRVTVTQPRTVGLTLTVRLE